MASTIYNIIIEQGADWFSGGIYCNADDAGKPDLTDPVDLTDYTARLVVRPLLDGKPNPDVELVDISTTDTADGVIELGGALGTYDVWIKSARTDEIAAPQKAVYDLIFTAPDGVVTRIWEGAAVVTPGVSTL